MEMEGELIRGRLGSILIERSRSHTTESDGRIRLGDSRYVPTPVVGCPL
jgi:hypothetical protein